MSITASNQAQGGAQQGPGAAFQRAQQVRVRWASAKPRSPAGQRSMVSALQG